MNGTINVLVKDKETHQESIITYKSFRDTAYRFNLIGQVDNNGNLMESDPNLLPQHQRKVPAKSPVVADAGAGHQINTDGAAVPERLVQRGLTEMRDRISDNILNDWSKSIKTGPEQSPEAVHDSVQEPIKERKKPGPKPKNKEQ